MGRFDSRIFILHIYSAVMFGISGYICYLNDQAIDNIFALFRKNSEKGSLVSNIIKEVS